MNLEGLFIELMQVAVGRRTVLNRQPTDDEWQLLYQMCIEQSVLGMGFIAVEKLYQAGYIIPMPLKLRWITDSQQIAIKNLQVNKKAIEISNYFADAGFQNCLLKGQGNAKLYSNPQSRMTGDIDLWVSGGKEKVCEVVKQRYPKAKECGWHIDYPVFNDVPVEVHFTPGYARSPKYDERLQAYFIANSDQQFLNKTTLEGVDGLISVPTFSFNIVVQLSHVLRHFMIEGIGMRHMFDFYYLLMNSEKPGAKSKKIVKLLQFLGLYNFASAVMWVMLEVFVMDREFCIVDPDKNKGKLLLDEILKGGNFGRYDKRKKTLISQMWTLYPFISRAVRFAWLFPEEALLTPIEKRIKL